MNKLQFKMVNWSARIIAALILFQTLFFKFTAHPQSVKLFSLLGVEPWGRIGLGILELIAGVLILVPGTMIWGALMVAGLMLGAVVAHLTRLGIFFDGDPWLFIYALIALICAFIVLIMDREKLYRLLQHLRLFVKNKARQLPQ
ncbi:DoxX family protein [Flavihumibacter rivuli]|uniref:DoxX family protein n=1 Tax=Flavihumibacter rivuli TaxID=2838156 RepID=UPI001BDE913C|nr:DoxX family protein [Flavihumibacter rivuli]ULQ57865.1 DoxX family protein [Flavihumibacter rivuli]